MDTDNVVTIKAKYSTDKHCISVSEVSIVDANTESNFPGLDDCDRRYFYFVMKVNPNQRTSEILDLALDKANDIFISRYYNDKKFEAILTKQVLMTERIIARTPL